MGVSKERKWSSMKSIIKSQTISGEISLWGLINFRIHRGAPEIWINRQNFEITDFTSFGQQDTMTGKTDWLWLVTTYPTGGHGK